MVKIAICFFVFLILLRKIVVLLNILSINNISKFYSEHIALNKVSITIPQNSIFGLLGPNGAGKTSLIRIITQITAPDSGEIYFNGEKLSTTHLPLTGYLPEERGLYKKMKVAEQLIYLGRLKGLSLSQAKSNCIEWLDRLELDKWKDNLLEDLSKGMQQKVQFIAAVIHNPSLVILDEPFTGFDPINAELVKNEILRLKENGATIILSTHRMESIEELCTHIAMVNKSKKILEGSIEEIKSAYKESIFVVEGKGYLPEGFHYKILGKEIQGAVKRYRIKAEGVHENEMIKQLIETFHIHLFKEEVPAIQDIFLSKVKGASHE